ncbi:class I SAM-dependent methyltransferase [Chitinophaga solisilvae]|uniref:class I SAM-dependent methyltransferase n=1 Tax=Chitinophaga solisilvae TaxID=1233460 RepID=UPI001369A7CE|nr:class I SAM-dependent methyltransferase [Chitinophaga solisilvae]
MKLLTEAELIWSPVVANTRMNRSRQATGVNSYEKEFGFSPVSFLEQRLAAGAPVAWLDVCCGEGRALLQAADYFAARGLSDKLLLKGIDLLPPADDRVIFETAAAVGWKPQETYDLITCSHGLHYLGDKLQVTATLLSVLKSAGCFAAHLDLHNIRIAQDAGGKYLKQLFAASSIRYDARRKLLLCTGPQQLHTGLMFLGADDLSGPNYTGQEAVTSYYRLMP